MINLKKIDVKVVVGANYGDEGKGLATHYFAQKAASEGKKVLNVFYNGGPQRGHTVELKDGTRHVFSHFGSGTFDGADTYFDRDFMVNPILFMHERKELEKISESIGIELPEVFIDENCCVTTPFDMILNQIIEESRGNNRHGSCGCGIFETRRRYNADNWSKYYDFVTMPYYESMAELNRIEKEWFWKRLKEEGINELPDKWKAVNFDVLKANFIFDIGRMRSSTVLNSWYVLVDKYDTIIFEGGQGLALSEDYKQGFPHLTPSKTGCLIPLRRVHDAIEWYMNEEEGIVFEKPEVCYVTRSYLTRHGAGTLKDECDKAKINSSIEDKTNEPNDFQGSIRYAPLHFYDLYSRVTEDALNGEGGVSGCHYFPVKTSLMVTHLNYTGGHFSGSDASTPLINYFHKVYLSYGKYAEDIKDFD